MAQLSVANFFNNRKRPIVEDIKLNNARKVLILDEDGPKSTVSAPVEPQNMAQDIANKIKVIPKRTPKKAIRRISTPRSNKVKIANQGNILQFLSNSTKKNNEKTVSENDSNIRSMHHTPTKATSQPKASCVSNLDLKLMRPDASVSTSDKKPLKQTELTLSEIAQKLSRSSRLAEIRKSLAQFDKSEQKLNLAQQKTQEAKDRLVLKSFKNIEVEVNLSPQKLKSPEKPYLSPKKNLQGPCRNLFGVLSPVKKDATYSAVKPALTLPYKYRYLAEMFRSIDTVCQILHNRKETITFKRLKPAVEEMLKRNLSEKHLAQIQHLYPDSYSLRREKLKVYGAGLKHEQWELVLVPIIHQGEVLTPEILLERRRILFNVLIEKVKDYHQEFLMMLDPPMEVDRAKITRWHPSFDIESVPDIEAAELPPQPNEEKLATGYEVLQKARAMFNCNTRMERALERLKTSSTSETISEPLPETSILKGIPKALLEKVRQKQAAKALESMTRSAAKDKEVELYCKLPEVARLTRNLFVTEKKSVLQLDLVLDKLCNSFRTFVTRNDMENYLRTIEKEVIGWLVFHELRGDIFVKLSKNSDLSAVLKRLEKLAEIKDL